VGHVGEGTLFFFGTSPTRLSGLDDRFSLEDKPVALRLRSGQVRSRRSPVFFAYRHRSWWGKWGGGRRSFVRGRQSSIIIGVGHYVFWRDRATQCDPYDGFVGGSSQSTKCQWKWLGVAAQHRMHPTRPIGPRVSAVKRVFSVSCRRGSFTHSARQVMRVPLDGLSESA